MIIIFTFYRHYDDRLDRNHLEHRQISRAIRLSTQEFTLTCFGLDLDSNKTYHEARKLHTMDSLDEAVAKYKVRRPIKFTHCQHSK